MSEEFIHGRDNGQEIKIKLLPDDIVKNRTQLGQAIAVVIRDELLDGLILNLGDEYTVVGTFKSSVLIAWHIHKKNSRLERLTPLCGNPEIGLTTNLRNLLLYVESVCSSSPWAFVGALISHLGISLFPETSYIHLKYGLFLSLASQKRAESPIPLIAIGADTFSSQKLIYLAGELAERCVVSSFNQNSLFGQVTGSLEKSLWEDIGDISLATDGVCILGDWTGYQKKTVLCDAVIKCVESNTASLTNRTNFKFLPNKPLPLRAALWTYWSHITAKKKDQLQLRTLINVFGMPFLADEKDDLIVQQICGKLLLKSSFQPPVDNSKITNAELKYFLKVVNSRDVELTEEASDLIKKFFVSSRKENPDGLPVGAIAFMSSLAIAHARLALRSEVTTEDVVLVIYLYQKSIWALFGESVYSRYEGLKKQPNEPIFVYIHKELSNFKRWLYNYVGMFLHR